VSVYPTRYAPRGLASRLSLGDEQLTVTVPPTRGPAREATGSANHMRAWAAATARLTAVTQRGQWIISDDTFIAPAGPMNLIVVCLRAVAGNPTRLHRGGDDGSLERLVFEVGCIKVILGSR